MPKERFKAYVAVYLVLRKKDKILMSKRANTGYQDGNYSMVAGHLDGSESATQGLIREAKEEAGIKLQEKDLKTIYIGHHLKEDKEYIDIFLETHKWEGEIKNMEPEKCDEIIWFSKNNLPKNIVPEVKLALKNIENNNFYSEFGFKNSNAKDPHQ